jgi:hypothetical protein
MIIENEPAPIIPPENPYAEWFSTWINDETKTYAAIQFERTIDYGDIAGLHNCIGNIQTLVLAFNRHHGARERYGFEIGSTLRGTKVYLEKIPTTFDESIPMETDR